MDDLDGDGRQDVFLYNATTGVWQEMISNGHGGWTKVGEQTWPPGWTLSFTDVNSDGRADILRYHPGTGAWQLARNLINGSFSYTNGTWAVGLSIFTRAQGR